MNFKRELNITQQDSNEVSGMTGAMLGLILAGTLSVLVGFGLYLAVVKLSKNCRHTDESTNERTPLPSPNERKLDTYRTFIGERSVKAPPQSNTINNNLETAQSDEAVEDRVDYTV